MYVSVCGGVGGWGVCARVRALRIVSTDNILCFINTSIIVIIYLVRVLQQR